MDRICSSLYLWLCRTRFYSGLLFMKDSFPSFTETVKPTTRFTAAQLYGPNRDRDHFVLRPQKRGGLLGTGMGGGGVEWGTNSEDSTADTARKRPERPWTAARTMEVLRRCPLAIAQRLVHCAIAVQLPCRAESQGHCPLHCC